MVLGIGRRRLIDQRHSGDIHLQLFIFTFPMSSSAGRFTTEYFPSVLTLRQMLQHQTVTIEYDENYQKNSLRNRCYLATSQGIQFLTVPLVKGKHQRQIIHQVRIAYDENWPVQHLRCMETNYNKAPYYSHYIREIQQLLYSHPDTLIELNWSILRFLSRAFHWFPSWSCSLDFGPSLNIHPSPDLPDFKPYPQVFEDLHGFLPNLSVLDLLFCIGPQLKYIQ